jgi:hypothetical protein
LERAYEEVEEMKIHINKRSGQASVTLPIAIVRAKGIKDKQDAEWLIDNVGQMILRIN